MVLRSFSVQVHTSLNMRDIIYVARWWEKYLSKRGVIKHTRSWLDKLFMCLRWPKMIAIGWSVVFSNSNSKEAFWLAFFLWRQCCSLHFSLQVLSFVETVLPNLFATFIFQFEVQWLPEWIIQMFIIQIFKDS